ncbi:cutinase family protein [Mycolicibacterium sp. P1-5]|uniref:cutinase family protein n=1 Tax=Mycolicibacterium sp. P1-5 TaxID=2024617 RepID=UPI0011EDB67B|nr:cutinase family protein [Mycolicibacterium sp. P1-5]KAA0105148.1 cutinase family protein [Mycolicibacterium sp. P1-5]
MASPTMTSARKLGVTSMAALSILTPITLAPAARAEPCSDVDVVFARGTSEPVGIGRVGQALADSLQAQLGGRSVSTYAVNYPASYDFLTAAEGAADATTHIAATAAACPSTRFVLGGYSQGAAVVDMLVGIPPLGNKVGDIGSGPPLPGNLANRVAGLAVFGNPSTKFGIPITSAGGAFAGKGVDFCNDGDPICSRGRNPFAHTDYERGPAPEQAAGFLAGLL